MVDQVEFEAGHPIALCRSIAMQPLPAAARNRSPPPSHPTRITASPATRFPSKARASARMAAPLSSAQLDVADKDIVRADTEVKVKVPAGSQAGSKVQISLTPKGKPAIATATEAFTVDAP